MGQVTILPYLHKKGHLIITTRTSRVMQISSIKQSQVCTTNETKSLLNHISNYQKFMLDTGGMVRNENNHISIFGTCTVHVLHQQLNIHKTSYYQY